MTLVKTLLGRVATLVLVVVTLVDHQSQSEALTVETLKTLAELKRMQQKSDKLVLGLFRRNDSKQLKLFQRFSREFKSLHFTVTHDDRLFKEMAISADREHAVVFLKRFTAEENKKRVFYGGEFDEASLGAFLLGQFMSSLNMLSPVNSKMLFNGRIKVNVILFANMKRYPKKSTPIYTECERAGETLRGRVLFVLVDTSRVDFERLLMLFSVRSDDEPSVALASFLVEDKIIKYKLANGLTTALAKNDILRFVNDFFANKLVPFLSSQRTPVDWNAKTVKVLTAENFERVVYDPTKSVLVYIYAPFECKSCVDFEPVFEEVAEAFEQRDEIVLGKLDGISNELEAIPVPQFPYLILFTRENNEMIIYDDEFTVDALSDFLEIHGARKLRDDEEDEDEETAALAAAVEAANDIFSRDVATSTVSSSILLPDEEEKEEPEKINDHNDDDDDDEGRSATATDANQQSNNENDNREDDANPNKHEEEEEANADRDDDQHQEEADEEEAAREEDEGNEDDDDEDGDDDDDDDDEEDPRMRRPASRRGKKEL